MARIRYLKPDFFFDDDLAELGFATRLFFQGLWCYADREGRLEDKPKVLKAQIMPYDSVNPEKILCELTDKFIVRYTVESRKYIQINNFNKHQKPHHTEKESLIPECNGNITVKQPSKDTLKEKEKEQKTLFLKSVYLTAEEHGELLLRFPITHDKKIENLDRYSRINPKIFKGYASHYDVILNWARDEKPEYIPNSQLPKENKPVIKTEATQKIAKSMLALGKLLGKGTEKQRKERKGEFEKLQNEMKIAHESAKKEFESEK